MWCPGFPNLHCPSSCRRKCKKDIHYHEHTNVHSYEEPYDLGDHYGGDQFDDGDDDLDLGSYGKGHRGSYLDDDIGDASSYKLGKFGKSSKYLMDDEADMPEGEMTYDEDLGEEEVASRTSSRNKLSPSKLLATSSGSLKKYFKKWKRRKPKSSSFQRMPSSEQSYEEVDETPEEGELEDSESGESTETYYPSTTMTPTMSNEYRTYPPTPTHVRHTSINSMTKASHKLPSMSTRKGVSPARYTTPASNGMEDGESESANSAEFSSPYTAQSEPEPAVEEARGKVAKKKTKLKKYLAKIKIGQYFKPYMLGIGKDDEMNNNASVERKERKTKKNHKLTTETSAKLVDIKETPQMPPKQPQGETVPMNEQQISGFYGAMGAPIVAAQPSGPSGPHPMMQPVMLMHGAPMTQQHPNGVITIMEQPGPFGYAQPPAQTIFVDPQTGQFLPGNPHLNHEIVAEQIVIQEPIDTPPSGHHDYQQHQQQHYPMARQSES